MNDTQTLQIRDSIRTAKKLPNYSSDFHNSIEQQISHLHTSIHLPEKNPERALEDFALRYIDHAPNFIDALRGLTKEAGIYEYTSIFLTIAEDFFTKPPKLVTKKNGLLALLSQAFLAHRLIEEINDRVIAHCGIPLAPMDMTRANLIVHQLLGEQHSNDLDFIVLYEIESRMDKEKTIENPAFHGFVEKQKQNGWSVELDRWPCLAENLSININFESDDYETVKPPETWH
jgi:hypothetical protein